MCQSFTASAAYTATGVGLKLYRELVDDTPGTVTVTLYLADNTTNKPTGDVLATGTTNGNTLTQDTDGEWRIIIYDSGYALTNGEEYVIVCEGSTTHNTHWIEDGSAPTYADGQGGTSNDSGASWTMDASRDHYFRVYGGTIAGEGVPVDKQYSKKLVVIGDNEIWYESAANTMSALSANDIDTTKVLSAVEAFQKVFIANQTNLKVADFANTKLTIADVTTSPTRGSIVTQSTGATMVVDFVKTDKTEIYGYTTSGTFDTTGTLSGGSMVPEDKVPTAVDEASTAPHWYDWTPYAGGASGTMPASAYLVCRYRGRLVLSGNPYYPHQWYMSKISDPWDWVYSSTDPLTAVAGNNTDAGEIGDIVRALIPFGDDFLVFGCANSIHILDGDAASGGSIDELSDDTGIFSGNSWCKDGQGNLYFYGNQGIYLMTGGRSKPTNISKSIIPNLVSDWAVNPITHRVVLSYDAANRGIIITKTTLADGTCSGYFYSLDTQGFYPISFANTADGIYCSFDYNADDPSYRKLLFGCNDGYIRSLLNTNKNDDYGASSTATISSYFGIVGPLSEDSDRNGKLTSLTIELAGGLATTKLTHAALTTVHAKGDTLTQASTWATGEDYTVGNVVVYSSIYYICIVEHTSDVDGGDGTGGTPDGNPTDWTVTTVATMVVTYSNTAKTLTFGRSATGTFTTLGGVVTGNGSGSDFTPTAVGTGNFTDTDSVSYEIHTGDDAETVVEKVRDGVAPHSSGTLSGAGRKNRIRNRVRAAWLAIKFYNSEASQTFGINKIFGIVKRAGRIR